MCVCVCVCVYIYISVERNGCTTLHSCINQQFMLGGRSSYTEMALHPFFRKLLIELQFFLADFCCLI